MPLVGPETVTVPGAVRAWETLSTLGGRLPLDLVLRPAIEHAREGVPVAGSLAVALQETRQIMADPGLALVFTLEGELLGRGDLLRQPILARSLETIADEGESALYGGTIGRRLCEGLRALGSPLALEDLAAHETEVTDPLISSYRGVEVLTAPPNSQGFVLLEILEAISGLEECPDPLGLNAPLLAEICRLASGDRDRYLADPRFAELPVGMLTSGEYGAQLLSRARSQVQSARRAGGSTFGVSKGDTVAVVAADSEGNAVSIVQSVFHTFGARILEPQTGILCHNRGAFFSLDPASPNVLAPRKRPAHTLMPVLVRLEGTLVGVQGAMGGKAQPQIHLQLLLRTLRSEPPDVALAAPRWVVGGLEAGQPTDVTRVEASAGSAVGRFRDAGMAVEVLEDRDEEVGHGQLVIRDGDGGFQAGSDPRSDGTAVIATR